MARKAAYSILVVCTMLMFSSCDKNIKKVEEMTNQFIDAVNKNDSAGLYNIYPTARDITNMTLAGNIFKGEVSVEHDDSTGFYTATIQNQHHQKLVFSADSLGALSVIDSYGILQLDSLPRKLALKCGMPLESVSDMEQAHLMDEKSLFLTYLEDYLTDKNSPVSIEQMLRYSGGTECTIGYDYSFHFCKLRIPIHNSGTKPVEGCDYFVKVECYKHFDKTYGIVEKTLDGVNISPNETYFFEISDPALFDWVFENSLRMFVDVFNRNNSLVQRLFKYGEFTGEEYKDFIVIQDDYYVEVNGKYGNANNEKKGHVDCYAEPSKGSKVTGSAYHRQPIRVICDEELQDWGKAYNQSQETGHYTLLGYIHKDEWRTMGLSDLFIKKFTTKSKGGGDIAIYKDESTKSDIVKNVKAGSNLFLGEEFDWLSMTLNSDFFAVYEPDGKGGYKMVGYIPSINIKFD